MTVEKEEKREEMLRKLELREKYEKEQKEKQLKWEEDMRRQGKVRGLFSCFFFFCFFLCVSSRLSSLHIYCEYFGLQC